MVVDDDVNMRGIMMEENTPIYYLGLAPPVSGLGSKMGLDATNKWPGETQREWGRPLAWTPTCNSVVMNAVGDRWN